MLPHALSTLLLASLLSPPTPASPGSEVAVLRLSGEHGEEVRAELQQELGASFTVRMLALDPEGVCKLLRCKDFEAEGLDRLPAWLARSEHTRARYIVYDRVDRSERRLVLYDGDAGVTMHELRYRDPPGDLILPIVTARALAGALREHLDPPPPLTEEDRAILAALDDDPPREPEIQACLSVIPLDPTYDPPPIAPESRGCRTGAVPPSPLLVMLAGVLVAARRRASRRRIIDDLADRGRLPPDVVARLTRRAPR